LQSKVLPPSKTKGHMVDSSATNVFQVTQKDAGHFVSMSSSKFGGNILGQMNSVEQVQTTSQNMDFSGFLNDSIN
jgi:hypothetical protein